MGMLPLLIAGIAALAIVVIAVGISMSGGGGVASRLERYASAEDDVRRGRRRGVGVGRRRRAVSRVIDRQDLAARLATDLARADLKMRPAEFLILWAITPIGFVFVAFILGFIFPGFRNPVALVGCFAARPLRAALLPRIGARPGGSRRSRTSSPTRSRCSRTRSAPAPRSSRAWSSSRARRGRRSARSSSASCATCSSASPSSRR